MIEETIKKIKESHAKGIIHFEDVKILLSNITEKDREIEEVRHILLFNHGHKGQYLDDGELQCSECLKNDPKLYDYKRGNIVGLIKKATGVMLAEIERLKENQHHEFCDSLDIMIPGKPCNCYLYYKGECDRLNALLEKAKIIIEGYRNTLKLMVKEEPAMQLRIDRLELFIKEMGESKTQAPTDTSSWIEDGFGSMRSKKCPMCGRDSMEVVRPGKVQCCYCG